MSPFPRHVAVIGGGRWARVTARVLTQIAGSETRLSLLSPSNPEAWADWRPAGTTIDISVAPDIDALLSDRTIEFVAIARAARDNAHTALAALAARKRVLIEKPFALTTREAERVVAAAENLDCSTGLVLLFAPNLRLFAKEAASVGAPREIHMVWRDARNEERHGEAKTYDATVNCVLDVFPHIWSVLRLIAPHAPMRAVSARGFDGGRRAALHLALGDAEVRVEIARDQETRVRTLHIVGAHGDASIDFSSEPGTARVGAATIDVSEGFSSPLAKELNAIARGDDRGGAAQFCQVHRAIESIRIADVLMADIRRDQRDQIARGLGSRLLSETAAAAYGLRELVGAATGRRDADATEVVRRWLDGEIDDDGAPPGVSGDADLTALKAELGRRRPPD